MAIQQLKGFINNNYKVIYDSGELTSAVTSLTISNLNGDVDEEYMLIGRIVAGADSTRMGIRPNNDTGNNYGYQMLWGISSSPGAERGGWNRLALDISGAQTGEISFVKCLLYAKSGYVRTALASSCDGIATTTVTGANLIGSSWNNTADNITSLTILQGYTNGFGIGSRIILLKKANIIGTGSGIKNIIAGTRKGSWKKIYETTLTDADAYTKLLLHCDDSILSDATGKTVTLNGTAQLDTTQKKFGIGSCLLDGDSDYLSLAHSDDWNFGSGDFTIDFWFMLATPTNNCHLYVQTGAAGYVRLRWIDNTFYFNDYNGTTVLNFSAPFSAAYSTWHHAAIVRNGNTWYIFRDGISQTLTLIAGSYSATLTDYEGTVTIGFGLDTYMSGRIDEYRISKGIARWTSDFTPQTEPYTSKLTSLVINNLNGNSDVLYRLRTRFINGYNGAVNYYLRPNNDSDADYGYQELNGTNATASAVRDTSEAQMHLGNAAAQNNLSMSETIIYAKSGYLRTAITELIKTITGTTVTSINLKGQVYQDTAINIISLVILSDQANGLGVGTVIELERLNL